MLFASFEEVFKRSDVFVTANFPCLVVVALRALVDFAELRFSGRLVQVDAVETRYYFIFDSAHY